MFNSSIHVRFNDFDAFGHVNNATFLTYFEEARVAFFAHIAWDWERDNLIVARNEINYRHQLKVDNLPVHIKLWCSKVGTSSFELEYNLYDKNDTLITDGKTVVVVYDYEQNQSQPISNEGRDLLEKYLYRF